MRTGITITVSPADLLRLLGLVKDRNAPQKHVWRAEIVLLGAGTNAIVRQTGKSEDMRLALAGAVRHGRV